MSALEERPARVTEVQTLQSGCLPPAQLSYLQFGHGGQTLLVSCDPQPSPLGGFIIVDNPNERAQFASQESSGRVTARVYDVDDGALRLDVATQDSEPASLLPIVRAMARTPWLTGTAYDANRVPAVFFLSQNGALQRLSPYRAQIISAAELNDGTAAVVYKAWTHWPEESGRLPETFVARINATSGDILSNNPIALHESAGNIVIGSSVTSERLTLFYRALDRAPTQSDWYVGNDVPVRLMRTDFGFDGAEVNSPQLVPNTDAAWVLPMPTGFIIVQGQASGCPNALGAILNEDGRVRRCFRRSPQDQSSDQVVRQPLSGGDYYRIRLMDGGRYVVIFGAIGPNDPTDDAGVRAGAHIFDGADGAYLGSVLGRNVTVSGDAPLVASAARDGEITIWRLSR